MEQWHLPDCAVYHLTLCTQPLYVFLMGKRNNGVSCSGVLLRSPPPVDGRALGRGKEVSWMSVSPKRKPFWHEHSYADPWHVEGQREGHLCSNSKETTLLQLLFSDKYQTYLWSLYKCPEKDLVKQKSSDLKRTCNPSNYLGVETF